MAVKLITDSTAYIDKETQQQLDITVIPLSVNFPDESFKETEVSYEYFYNKLADSAAIPTSSQPSPGDFYLAFNNILAQGHAVLGIFISADMSGTYLSALSAREKIQQENPAARIEILDSRTNSLALGLPVIAAAKAAQEGKTLAEIAELARQMIKRMHFYFVPANLEYLKKGGRIGGAAALIGSVLNIKPILYVNQGTVAVWEKVRGARAATERLLRLLEQESQTRGLKEIVIHHINVPERASELAQDLSQRYGLAVPTAPIGPVIGLHVGPGSIGLVFCTESAE